MSLLRLCIRFLNLLSGAIVGGGQLTVLWVIVPVKRELDVSLSVRIHRAMLGDQIDRFMQPFGILSILSGLLLLLLAASRLLPISRTSFAIESVGVLGTVGVILTSRYGNVPTNRFIGTWSLADIPKDYPQIRTRWDRIHGVRTLCGVVALSCYVLSTLLNGPGRG